jgi:hypothetical protein
VIAHCLVVGWSSRVLIRESPMSSVILALAGALLIATLLLFATARRVTVPS